MHLRPIFWHVPRTLIGLGLGAWIGLSGCSTTQKAAGPLWLDLPDQAGEGAGAAKQYSPVGSVIRHSSPVWVRRPGASAGTLIAYYDKRVRVQGGARVRVGFGGRAELLWPDRASSIVLFNSGEARFGDQALDEPLLALSQVGRAQITLSKSDHVLLPGGADLRGDGSLLCGPILVDSLSPELMRVKNQSKQVCQVRYRGVSFKLLGGETIDLPILLGAGASEPNPLLERAIFEDREVLIAEGLRAEFDGYALRVHAESSGDLALGEFVLHLVAGERAVISSLGDGSRTGSVNSSLPAQE